MAAQDGISFHTIAKSEKIRKGLIARGFTNVPKSANSVRSQVVSFSKHLRIKDKEEISTLKKQGQKFSVTLDEWTSLRKRRLAKIKFSSLSI